MIKESSTQEEKESIDDDKKNSSSIKSVTPYSNYSIDEKKSIVTLYNNFTCKLMALKFIQSIEGYEKLNVRRIKRWQKQTTLKSPGRPISEEFEDEVLLECKQSPKNIKKIKTVNMYPYALIKECAKIVLNKEYCDNSTGIYTKKWLHDSRTNKLKFTNKWILGVIQRGFKKSQLATSVKEEDDVAYSNEVGANMYNNIMNSVTLSNYRDEVLNNYFDLNH